MEVITSGWRYMDIDAYAGCIAYAELRALQGEQAVAVSTAPLNQSVTKTVRNWGAELMTDYVPNRRDRYVIIDTSDPEFFDRFVKENQVTEIIDHHMEKAAYWHDRLGAKAQIEFVGAACTLVAERWQTSDSLDKISETSARLLMTGILDNTLNFKARVSTERDTAAYSYLTPHANLSESWAAQYFGECQQAIMQDLPAAVQADMKEGFNLSIIGNPVIAGQLVVWDAAELIRSQRIALHKTLSSAAQEWFMNLVSIDEGKSYFIASDSNIETALSNLLEISFHDGIGEADRLWLRKEIMKQDLDRR